MSTGQRAFVWGGGALFVAALAASGWTFARAWSTPLDPPPDQAQAAVIDAALIMLFAAHHSLAARERVKSAIAHAVPPHLIRSLYVWIASLLLLLVLWLWQPVGGVLFDSGPGLRPLHAALQLAGLWFTVWGVRAIDPLELAGIRSASGDGGALQTRGAYRLVRHPLYLGWLLMVFGVSRMTGDRFVFACLTSLYLVVAIPWEERSLRRAFGAEYTRYQTQVRWRMIPFVY